MLITIFSPKKKSPPIQSNPTTMPTHKRRTSRFLTSCNAPFAQYEQKRCRPLDGAEIDKLWRVLNVPILPGHSTTYKQFLNAILGASPQPLYIMGDFVRDWVRNPKRFYLRASKDVDLNVRDLSIAKVEHICKSFHLPYQVGKKGILTIRHNGKDRLNLKCVTNATYARLHTFEAPCNSLFLCVYDADHLCLIDPLKRGTSDALASVYYFDPRAIFSRTRKHKMKARGFRVIQSPYRLQSRG